LSSTRLPLPEDVLERLRLLSGSDPETVKKAFGQDPNISVRLNPLKPTQHLVGEQVVHCEQGQYLKQRPSFVMDPLFHAGAYYVQEASSMLVEQFVLQLGLQHEPLCALDLCAAPGGKSTHLRALLHPDSLLICNEVSAMRRNVLEENMLKWGHRNIAITQARSASFLKLDFGFDLILIDAPCSGAGMMRKDPFAIEQWSASLVADCVTDQRQLLADAWELLNPGGVIIYSTCTFTAEENEKQLRAFLEERPGELFTLENHLINGVISLDQGCYMLPHLVRGEGIFMSAIRKPGVRVAASNPQVLSSIDPPLYCAQKDQYFYQDGESIWAIGERWSRHAKELLSELKYAAVGVPVAEKKGKEWFPHAGLALSELLDRENLEEIVLSEEEALKLLSGEVLRRDVQSGHALASFAGLGLMWLKGAGNRWNQRWPKKWRIRKYAQ